MLLNNSQKTLIFTVHVSVFNSFRHIMYTAKLSLQHETKLHSIEVSFLGEER